MNRILWEIKEISPKYIESVSIMEYILNSKTRIWSTGNYIICDKYNIKLERSS